MTKRLLFICATVLLPMLSWAGLHSYAERSVLSEGRIIKIQVAETGIYAITYDQLKDWGLQPEQVRLLGYGGNMLNENFTLSKWDDLPSVAFYMHKGADNKFSSGDYILFYGRGSIGWEYGSKRWRHTRNPYSDYGYYFLSDSAGEQRLITTVDALSDSDAKDVDWFTRCMLHEKEMINLVDKTGVNGGGREFYGESLSESANTLKLSFAAQHVRRDMPMTCVANLASGSQNKSQFTLSMGGNNLTTSFSGVGGDFYERAKCDSIIMQVVATSTGTQTVRLLYSGTSSSDVGYLNYVELLVPTNLVMAGREMPIVNTAHIYQNYNTRFLLSSPTPSTQIWRVTNGVDIQQMPTTITADGRLSWIGTNQQAEMYMAVDVTATGWRKPTYVGVIDNQNLHALSNIDYVIICPEEFRQPALRLAQKHEQIDHLTWAVVTDQQVYNEFSSGTPDVSAYRWFMKMLYDRAEDDPNKQPKNLLLMGCASFDNRNLYGNLSGDSRLLVFQAKNSVDETKAYGMDDYCGFLQDNAGVDTRGRFSEVRAKMDIGVGRLPVYTLEQANQVVDKLCLYMDDRVQGKWKNQICFLADDGDHGLHVQTADIGAKILAKENPNFVINKIYLDSYTQEVMASGERYPLAKNQFDNLMTNGVLYMNYSGHGGYNNITNELFMTTKDIRNMTNVNHAFWSLATCSFSHFDAGVVSAGEEAVLNPYGGAIGVLSACRTVYATQNTILNKNLCDTLFGHTDVFSYNMTIGQAVAAAKNQTGSDTNKLPYVLLGDPALRLNYPTDYAVRTTSMPDTLYALTEHTICGYIQDASGDTATWFNGTMDFTIWDKMQQIRTKDNDELNDYNKVRLTFDDYPNTLFAGKTNVVDGKFQFTFMVPRDIRYEYGNGRIVYYAYDTQSREEAIGHFEDLIVGGSSAVEIVDTIGPEINIYLNNPAFQDGDQTYEFPHFFADIYDEHGINTVGSGIGHDLMMVIDEDPKLTFVLNDYFMAQNNSYQRGMISYKMPEMTEGAHTMTFRAWDLLNNSSTASLNFQVVKGLDPTIYQVISYPNPVNANGLLNFRIEFDQPNEVVHTEIRLFDLSGKLVYEYAQTGASGIQWNLSEINAAPGVYVYQVKIQTPTSNFVSKAGKIIITQ